jgi:hypothetical protein
MQARRVRCYRRRVGPFISEPVPRARLDSRTCANLWAGLARVPPRTLGPGHLWSVGPYG